MNYQPRGGRGYRLSLDAHFGKRVEGKTEAAKLATLPPPLAASTLKTRQEAAADAAPKLEPAVSPDAMPCASSAGRSA